MEEKILAAISRFQEEYTEYSASNAVYSRVFSLGALYALYRLLEDLGYPDAQAFGMLRVALQEAIRGGAL